MPKRDSSRRARWTIAGFGVVVTLLLAVLAIRSFSPNEDTWKGVVRFPVAPPEGFRFRTNVEEHSVAVCPDGKTLVFVARDNVGRPLWIRSLSDLSPQPLPGTRGASSPFWSPNGRCIGFASDGKLKKIPATGGIPQTICEIQGRIAASWGRKGDIIFTVSRLQNSGILRVRAEEGGEPSSAFDG